MTTLKGELLPFVVKKQLSKYCQGIKSNENKDEDDAKLNIFNVSKEFNNENNIRSLYGVGNKSYTEDIIKCYACKMDSNIGVRANTLYDYCKINKIVSNLQK